MNQPIRLFTLAALLLHVGNLSAERWPLDAVGAISTKIHGTAKPAAGVSAGSLVLDGASVIELPDTARLHAGKTGFTFSVWLNSYAPKSGQQVIAGKSRYSLGQREWTVTMEPTGMLRAHLWQSGWSTITCPDALRAGQWYRLTLTVANDVAALYVNGKHAGDVTLTKPIHVTETNLTLGGIVDDGRLRQQFSGALDDAHYHSRVLSAEEIRASYQPVDATHIVPKTIVSETPLWDDRVPLSNASDLPVIEGARFSVIKPYEFAKDGYRFLHGVALCFHKGKLYASFGHNKGGENTDTEEAHWCVSNDNGQTWSTVKSIDAGREPDIGVSHGAFLSHHGKLWAFQGAYRGTMNDVHTRAYVLDEATQQWRFQRVVIEDGFWPMQQPLKMKDGNWIMAGLKVGDGNPAIVAISHGDDFSQWDVIPIPRGTGRKKMWGESTVIVSGNQVTNISRYGADARALVSTSNDYGRSWSQMLPSNLPMATSKPYAGILSTGQRYLVCTTSADSRSRRSPLTIAVTKPGESVFTKVFVIRNAVFPEGPGESHPKAALSYPYAIEHDGRLYIGYSNNGGNVGRVGEGRELWNNNSAELAVVSLKELRVER